MTQIKNLLYSTRIPTKGKDIIKKADEKANHVIVLSNGTVALVTALLI